MWMCEENETNSHFIWDHQDSSYYARPHPESLGILWVTRTTALLCLSDLHGDFYKVVILVTFVVKNYSLSLVKTSCWRNKPRTSAFFPSSTYLLNPFLPWLGCNDLSWSLLEIKIIHSATVLRLFHVSLLRMQDLSAAHCHQNTNSLNLKGHNAWKLGK